MKNDDFYKIILKLKLKKQIGKHFNKKPKVNKQTIENQKKKTLKTTTIIFLVSDESVNEQ